MLFGSHARGDWVDDPKGGYISNYGLLVVVDHDDLTDLPNYWSKVEDGLLTDYQIAHRLSAPVNLIVQSLREANDELR